MQYVAPADTFTPVSVYQNVQPSANEAAESAEAAQSNREENAPKPQGVTYEYSHSHDYIQASHDGQPLASISVNFREHF